MLGPNSDPIYIIKRSYLCHFMERRDRFFAVMTSTPHGIIRFSDRKIAVYSFVHEMLYINNIQKGTKVYPILAVNY